PEIRARGKAPVPGERVARAPRVLLPARNCVEPLLAAVDLDGSRDAQRRLRPDVRDRRQPLPAWAQERKRRLARLPAQVPAGHPTLCVDLACAAVPLEDGAPE